MRTEMANDAQRAQEIQEANSCMAIGAGIGALGLGATLIAGATCPLCVIATPALIGVGAWKRFAAGRKSGPAVVPREPQKPGTNNGGESAAIGESKSPETF